MDASSHASWSRIPRDYHEQQRVQLEHRLFASTAHSNSLSDTSFNLEEEGNPNNLNMNSDSDGDNEANGRELRYSSSEFSMEYPRNPQVAADDYSLSNPYHRRDGQPREGDTKSTFAHHASGITFRTGLRGPSHSRRRDFSGDLSRGLSDLSIDYDPDRPLDALLQRASNLSILQDSPRDAPKSEFTTRAQGLAKQMAGQSQDNSYQASAPATINKTKDGSFAAANVTIKPYKPLSELARTANTPLKSAFATTRVFPAYAAANGRTGVQLPDVTGITSAVATPLKGDASFRRAPDPKPTSRFSRQQKTVQPSSSKPTASSSQPENLPPANPTGVLDTLSHRLHQIERESLTSRRRVTELERELDLCRSVVDIERSKMGELSMRAERKRRLRGGQNTSSSRDRRAGNAQVVQELDAGVLDASFRETQRRYREAVGEEKELEALVRALHAHLRRTSTTVESQKQMISDLRAEAAQTAQAIARQQQQDRRPSSSRISSDAREADKIWDEVERVKSEVELLWGDVGRLRDVVEGGLGVRRAREGGFIGRASDGADVITGSIVRGNSLRDMSDEEGSTGEEGHEANDDQQYDARTEPEEEQPQEELVDEVQRPEWGAPVLSAVLEEDEPASTRASTRSTTQPLPAPGRFIQDAELERVRAEVEERRSLRSMSMSGSDRSGNGGATAMRTRALDRVAEVGAGGRVSPKPDYTRARVPSSLSTSKLSIGLRNGIQQHTPPRPLTPDSEGDAPSFAAKAPVRQQERPSSRMHQVDKEDAQRASSLPSPVLPQIRGERLERLFYAAPEHDSRTCKVCHRRRRTEGHGHGSASGSPTVPTGANGEVRFCEGDERRIAEIAKQNGVPPQTVLARVLRELEDDFAHYKSIYVELADQYKAMDAASDMGKRNLLANHLREVIDILEQKGDQIASLYDLLHFEDKPLATHAPIASSSRHHHNHSHGRRTRLS